MHQAAAFPFRRTASGNGAIEVLLVDSRSGRWIIPKGDVEAGMPPHLAAEKEAFEEGGVRGRIDDRPLGKFHARKVHDGAAIDVEVIVYPLEVGEELARWPEDDRRRRRWLPVEEAAEAVADAELAEIFRQFAE